MDWKWLFFYPDQGIATVNELTAPVDRPIRFEITATTMMNSFFVPALAGQVYAMPGMETKLHAVVNKPGVYDGFSANYSGAGFSGMRFKFHGVSPEEFDAWVAKVKAKGENLSRDKYEALAKPSEWVPVHYYADVSPNLYDAILNRCVQPGQTCLKDMMDQPNHPHAGRARTGKADALLAGAMCTARNTAQFAQDTRRAPGEALTQ
ncbi:Ubiquinol oxidase subunit 2 precursor [Pandoraea pulmonicola]|nr:Ubiquinol oxidase subunit 2 precursor [Pandoraea pulmonicola]